jgi:RNA-binding protein YhbY
MTLLSQYVDNDDGNGTNMVNLTKDQLEKRKVVKIDIVNDE